jgi:hypothetical protein
MSSSGAIEDFEPEPLSLTRLKLAGIIVVMPKSLQRALLALVLAVAVPLQGYAAVNTGICRALAHHGDEPAASVEHGHHGAEHAGADHDKPGSPDDPSAKDTHHCAACASCGVAAAISAAPLVYASDSPHQGVVAADSPAPEGYVPEGLDRPPLTLLV